MASRKEQKEQARAARVAQEQAAAEKAHRTRRMQLLGGIVVVAVVIIGVAVAISSSGSTPTGIQSANKTKPIVHQVDQLLTGIPQNGTVLGNAKAPVTLTYFGDLECPICRAFTLDSLPQFVQNQVRTGKAKIVYRSFCTATCNGPGQNVFNTQQVAAYAAGKQQKFWHYAELFYHEQGTEGSNYANEKYLTALAAQIPGLKVAQWKTDRGDPALLSQVQGDEQAASNQQLGGTPALIMTGAKGSETVTSAGGGVPAYSDLATAVSAVS